MWWFISSTLYVSEHTLRNFRTAQSLPLLFPAIPLLSLPFSSSVLLEADPLIWRSAVKSPSWIWGEATSEIGSLHFSVNI